MESHEAMKRCFGGYVKGKSFVSWFSKKLLKSKEIIYMWSRPHDDYSETGTKSDLDRLEETIILSLSCTEISREDSIAPIVYLEERFNRVGMDLDDIKDAHPIDLLKLLSKTIKEFSDLTQTASLDLGDNGRIDNLRAMQKEGWEAIRAIFTLMKKAERSAQSDITK